MAVNGRITSTAIPSMGGSGGSGTPGGNSGGRSGAGGSSGNGGGGGVFGGGNGGASSNIVIFSFISCREVRIAGITVSIEETL
tara:strand:- start:169 stop:417 length:249 start_codon:yes stop_codon:yes gene_type:complete